MPTVYSPLPDDHIRLLIVQPGAFQDDISTSLVPHYLGDESDAKRHAEPYEAVSYVWGSPELTKSIRCDEHEIQVTENVDVLLRHLRLPDAPPSSLGRCNLHQSNRLGRAQPTGLDDGQAVLGGYAGSDLGRSGR